MKFDKSELLSSYGLDSKNTGSYASQIILLNFVIKNVIEHLSKNKKDVSAKRFMLKKLAIRKKFLLNLKKINFELYSSLIKI
ncbi:MAG TPA: 30S ribosomal protein S15 [Mycoplasmatales bacterium]|jgi:small subunit ribosomal protein S15|nr:30S ribosomal protein S15 [Mycoplasmatales bacterium]